MILEAPVLVGFKAGLVLWISRDSRSPRATPNDRSPAPIELSSCSIACLVVLAGWLECFAVTALLSS